MPLGCCNIRCPARWDLGAALTAYLDENAAVRCRVEQYGAGGLTYEEQFGTTGEDGLCEEAAASDPKGDGGREYVRLEARGRARHS